MVDSVEFYDRSSGERNEAYARKVVADDLAQQGYKVDRRRPVAAARHGSYWLYVIPVKRVVS